ncbi:vacuolar protein sorting-associated protein 37B [Eublepharis macularius]|uniref:Vacuolar protein sorting-associated protein 37B n=1 Tax=Eublepharis macularius TaxID=481883 RepID=A0AA97LEE2_EUBMA|nr:vacuolar protein sorting-associated protein 37B [Eublepharis macularius]
MAVDVKRLEGLSLQQLNELLEDEEQLQGMAREMEEAQNVQLSKDMTLASNRSLAEGNLLYQPKLDALKATLTQKYQELQVLFEAYQIKKTKLDRQSSNASLETLLALLQTEGAKIEEDTENMAEKFLDGEVPLDAFIDEYQSQRKLAHLRRVKIEKLQEMVLKGQRIPQVTPQPRATETPSVLQTVEVNAPPLVMPRRNPPPPPPASVVPVGRFPTPFTAAIHAGPALPYPSVPYPPLPPRTGVPPTNQMPPPRYPPQLASQFPPALPQRPAPRLPPNPGFILQ